jgi:hypothetical protein
MTLRLLTAVAAVATLAATSVCLAWGAPIEHSTIPLSFTTDASCTGESIAFDGTMRLFRDETENSNGSHFHGHVTAHLDGIGLLSRAKYVGTINAGVNVNIATSPRESSNMTLVSNIRIVNAGQSAPSDDYSEHIIVRLTITANGEERAYMDAFRGGCD